MAVYGDRGLLVWDLADLTSISLSRCCLAHSSCIWDLQFLPWRTGQQGRGGQRSDDGEMVVDEEQGTEVYLPPGVLATCSADNTVRLWCLGGEAQQAVSQCGRPQTRELLATLHMDEAPSGEGAGQAGRPPRHKSM